jgi:hypothetical protein
VVVVVVVAAVVVVVVVGTSATVVVVPTTVDAAPDVGGADVVSTTADVLTSVDVAPSSSPQATSDATRTTHAATRDGRDPQTLTLAASPATTQLRVDSRCDSGPERRSVISTTSIKSRLALTHQ